MKAERRAPPTAGSRRRDRRRWLLRLLVLLVLAAATAAAARARTRRNVRDAACRSHLEILFLAADRYAAEHGVFPVIAFYPDEPRDDPAGLPSVLGPFGVEPAACVCPAAPALLRDTGLTYVWNTDLSGRPPPNAEHRVWMAADLQTVSPEVPRPHRRRYHVLYTDGSVAAVRDPPF